MSWDDDTNGKRLPGKEIEEVKLYAASHTWKDKLSNLKRMKGKLRIVTYSLPNMSYIKDILAKRPKDIQIIAHSKFKKAAQELADAFPKIEVRVCDHVHTKVCMYEPKTVYTGSANFGYSSWNEITVGIRSKIQHDWYLENEFIPLWEESIPVESATRSLCVSKADKDYVLDAVKTLYRVQRDDLLIGQLLHMMKFKNNGVREALGKLRSLHDQYSWALSSWERQRQEIYDLYGFRGDGDDWSDIRMYYVDTVAGSHWRPKVLDKYPESGISLKRCADEQLDLWFLDWKLDEEKDKILQILFDDVITEGQD